MAGGGLLGFLQNFGGGELLVILLVALLFLGPERLPEFARNIGKGIHRLRSMTEGMSSQMKDVIDDPAMQPLRELGEFAARPRQKLAEYALEAEAEERARKEAPSPATPPSGETPVDDGLGAPEPAPPDPAAGAALLASGADAEADAGPTSPATEREGG